MPDLLEAINQHYHEHGQYPSVRVSFAFDPDDIEKLIRDGITVTVDPQLKADWRLE